MKKVLILLIGMFVSLTSFSKSFRVGDFEYEIKKNSLYNNGVILKKYLSKNQKVEIPEYVNYEGTKYTVENIGPMAFKDNNEVLSLIVPGSVYVLELGAFCNLKNLRNITFLPTKMEQEIIIKKRQPKDKEYSEISPNLIISVAAFENCESLETIDLSNRRTFIYVMGHNGAAFRNCKSLKDVFFGDVGFSNEKDKLFNGCHSIEQFIIGTKNPSKYKKFFESDAPFMTNVYPKIVSMSQEEYISYFNQVATVEQGEEPTILDYTHSESNAKNYEENRNSNVNQDLIITQDIMTIPMQRKDLNGNICALLKVMVVKKGLTFEGNIIGDVEYKNGNQYWAYLSPGTKKIKINIPGEKTKVLDLDKYPEFPAFESKRIYEFSFETTPTQKLNLTYTPTDAMILIDGNLHDGQNGEIHIDLPLGEHSYMVVGKGYVTSEGIVKLTSNGQANIIVNLTPVEK